MIPPIRLSDSEMDRTIAEWWDETKRVGKTPSLLVRYMIYGVLTGTNPVTGKPLTINILNELTAAMSGPPADDEGDEDYALIQNIRG